MFVQSLHSARILHSMIKQLSNPVFGFNSCCIKVIGGHNSLCSPQSVYASKLHSEIKKQMCCRVTQFEWPDGVQQGPSVSH